MVVVKHREWLIAFRSQLSEQLKPNKLFKYRDEINRIIQELDTQDVHNRGHG